MLFLPVASGMSWAQRVFATFLHIWTKSSLILIQTNAFENVSNSKLGGFFFSLLAVLILY